MSGDGRVVVYEDNKGKFRWSDYAGNGEIIADSGQGYTDTTYAVEMAARQAHGRPVTFRDADLTEADVVLTRAHLNEQALALATETASLATRLAAVDA